MATHKRTRYRGAMYSVLVDTERNAAGASWPLLVRARIGISGRIWARLSLLTALLTASVSAGTTGGFVIDTQDRFLARASYNSVYVASEGLSPAWTGNLASCAPGTTTVPGRPRPRRQSALAPHLNRD